MDFRLHILKNAEKLKETPKQIKDETIIKLYDMLRKNKLNVEEMEEYNKSVLELQDMSIFLDYAKMEGERRGEKRGKEIGKEMAYNTVVINAADKGMSIKDIADLTSLSIEQVQNILAARK